MKHREAGEIAVRGPDGIEVTSPSYVLRATNVRATIHGVAPTP